MADDVKRQFLESLRERFPSFGRLPGSQSLYHLGGAGRVYIRYSKLHPNNRTFYGLRRIDLQQLEGHDSLICFLWDTQQEPLLVSFQPK